MRPAHLVRAALGLAIAAALAGCEAKGRIAPSLAPETSIFVQGAVDTVNHVVDLHWFGADVDGFVVAYEYRLLNPAQPAETLWTRTTGTEGRFTVYTPEGYTAPEFQVRAIDDEGNTDPTPARQGFQFSNQPPTVTIGFFPQPNDTTFATLTLDWTAYDPDGDGAAMRFRVWLDGDEDRDTVVTANPFTVPRSLFFRGGSLVFGPRTVYVQAIDDGGFAGPADSARWVVRPATTADPSRGRVLLIDDVPAANVLNARTDSLYLNTLTRNLPPGTFTVLRFDPARNPFRSTKDVEQTFLQFDAVIWYRGTETRTSTILSDLEPGFSSYLDQGGSMLVESVNLVAGPGSFGSLSPEFVSRHLDTDHMYKNFAAGQADSSIGWGIGTGRVIRSSTLADSLRFPGIYTGLRGFAVKDTQSVAMWARAGTLSQPHDYDIPVLLAVPQASGGTLVAVTFPMVVTTQPATGFAPRGSAVLAKLVGKLGVIDGVSRPSRLALRRR